LEFRGKILGKLVTDLKAMNDVFAVWEGGSAANSTTDQYSDIDFCILGNEGQKESIFGQVKTSLNSISKISHIWSEEKSFWPELTQKIYILEDSPKHFLVDVSLFPKGSDSILSEFMQIERHGTPVTHFDKLGLIVPKPVDKEAIFEKQRKQLSKFVDAFPVFRIEVYKELDRGNNVDAFAFFQMAMLKPTVEVLGMIHRPFQFDFGLRYLKRSFPPDIYNFIEKCMFMSGIDEFKGNVDKTNRLFYESVNTAKEKLEMR
jgi:hypothetical protein